MKNLFTDQGVLSSQQRLIRLRCFTLLFFTLLLVPVSVIFYYAFSQFEQEQFAEYKAQTSKLTDAIKRPIFKRNVLSNGIADDEFDYYLHRYNPVDQQFTQILSPLSNPEYKNVMIGTLGYFQIDLQGQFNSPVWPFTIDSEKDKNAAISELNPELVKRRNLALKLRQITSQSQQLQLMLERGLVDKRDKFGTLSDIAGYFIYYRVVGAGNLTKLQGFVIDRKIYLQAIVKRALGNAQFNAPTAVTVHLPESVEPQHRYFYRVNSLGQVEVSQPNKFDDSLSQLFISEHKLSWPYDEYRISYSTSSLQLTSAATYSLSLMLILIVAIFLGCYGFYRIGVKQLKLAEQRLNFVSSVSHELKTPLTSIRMYSEMLKTGQVLSDKHQNDYYEFIFSESERLSRLIDNILQLAKLSQPQQNIDLQYTKLSTLIDIIHSKVSSLVIKNEFQLNISNEFEDPEAVLLLVDVDAFSQVVINITDNAVKFFDGENIDDTNRRKIDLKFSIDPAVKEYIQFTIRDYGPGISAAQEDKLFDLFYRGGSELTRTTQGTGIGLALVNELMFAQQGKVKVQRMKPGLAMNMLFRFKSL